MGTKIKLPIVGGSYQHPSQPANDQKCINWLVSAAMPTGEITGNNALNQGRTDAVLLRTIGCRSLGTVNNTDVNPICTGFFQIETAPGTYLNIVCMNLRIYKLTFNVATQVITPTLLGTLTSNYDNIAISANPTQIIFVTPDTGAIYNYVTNTFTTITDVDYLKGTHVVMIDGYFIMNQPRTQKFYVSDLNNGLSYNGLNIATAEGAPDTIVGLGRSKSELWIFGAQHIEVWYDAGNSPGMPFSKRVGSDIDVGCAAPYSITNINEALAWIDSRRFIVMSDYSQFFRNQSSGYKLTKISTEAIDNEIASYSTVLDAIGSTYNDDGHIMLEFTFPTANKTWVFDTSTNMWHERSTHNPDNDNTEQSLTNFYIQNEAYTLGASRTNNSIYLVSRDYLDDDGEPIRRVRVTKPFVSNSNQLTLDYLEVKCNSGLAPYDITPSLSLRYSNDSGYTWSDFLARDIGERGEYGKRLTWNCLGSAHEWMFEFTMADPIDVSIIDAIAEGSEGDI